jgi:hypothetical protein
MADILSVVVGGVLTLAGSAGMQWYLHREKTAEERRVKRAAKFEELVTSIYDYDHWLTKQRNIRVFGEKLEEESSPFSKVQAIVVVYFPRFADQLEQLEDEKWMFECGQRRIEALKNEQPIPNFIGPASQEAYADYLRCKISLLHQLQRLARDGFE